jgi:tetratricopeptide (TPR) repeat protein
VLVDLERGRLNEARRTFSRLARLDESSDNQDRSTFLSVRASLQRAAGRLTEALADAEEAIEVGRIFGIAAQAPKHGLVEALQAAVALGDATKTEELLGLIDAIPPGTRPPLLDAHANRVRARLTDDVTCFQAAAERFRSLDIVFWLAVTLLEHAECLGAAGRGDEARPLLDEARDVFERLDAAPWLARIDETVGAGRA